MACMEWNKSDTARWSEMRGIASWTCNLYKYQYVHLVDDFDINADVTFKEFVDEYERLYGPQTLSECDLNTHLDSAFTCQPPLKNDVDPVKVDFRNKELVKKLVAAEQQKIVVLFGAYHIKDLEKMLKRYQ